jgi:tetratricopeptide (TPR) repeat protein
MRGKPQNANPKYDFHFEEKEACSLEQENEAWRKTSHDPAPPPSAKPEIQGRELGLQTQAGIETPNYYQKGLVWLQKRQYREAMQSFLTYLQHQPKDAAACHQIARLYANEGQLATAQQWAEQAIEHNPFYEEAYYTLALIQRERGELEAAIPRLKKALYLKPDFILAHLSLADFYQQLGRSADATRHRDLAIRLAARLAPETVLPGSDDLLAGQLLARA